MGSAWPGHFNQPLAEDMYENIKKVGMPKWTDADQTLAGGELHRDLAVGLDVGEVRQLVAPDVAGRHDQVGRDVRRLDEAQIGRARDGRDDAVIG